MKKITTILVILILGGFLVAGSASALMIKLDDGLGNSVIVEDGDASDSSSEAGVVTYNGNFGSSVWTVNITTGISDPVIGSSSFPKMDLNSVNVTTTGQGTLDVWITDNNFVSAIGGYQYQIGGTTNGTIDFTAYGDAGNVDFGTDTVIGSLGTFGAGAFSGSGSGLFSDTDAFSLSMLVQITHDRAGQVSSFDAALSPVPEPATMLLLGTGLLGLAGISRKKFKK